MGSIVTMLAKFSLQPSSIPAYRRAWWLFYQFLNATFHSVWQGFFHRTPYIGYVKLTCFCIRLFSQIFRPSDPSKAFFIIQILNGYGKIGSRLDSRLPITLPVLNRIIESSAKLSLSQYQRSQLQAMCSTAFFAFLRIGEISCNSPKDAGVPLQVHHLVN